MKKTHQFYTVADVQGLLKLSRGTVYNMIWTKQLPSVKIGKLVRIPADALHAWMDAK